MNSDILGSKHVLNWLYQDNRVLAEYSGYVVNVSIFKNYNLVVSIILGIW